MRAQLLLICWSWVCLVVCVRRQGSYGDAGIIMAGVDVKAATLACSQELMP